ncbi:MAG: peptidase C45 [Bacteroidetes bacterium]|nr:peptidase C45 [Bacteroidota bacterium]
MQPKRKKFLWRSFITLISLFVLVCLGFFYLLFRATLIPPSPENFSSLNLKREVIEKDYYRIGNNWIKKNEAGLWEMYVEGKPFERGVVIGKLTKELIKQQEDAFVAEIHKIIPSDFYLGFLKYLVGWFNRDIDKFVEKEYLLEIFGESFSAAPEYSYIGTNYERILNYHAAHDIGHALQDYHFVGCTSFSAWNAKSEDSSLITGRNFDFYVGDDFAKEKIICFMNPDKGYKMMTITWGGMLGAISGMNEKGLTVTMNAAKSNLPSEAATPISLLTREILQYSKNINEAFDIAKKRQTFVSESIMISSAEDNRTAIIEKTPYQTSLFDSDTNYIICTNHYQSQEFKNDKSNIENIKESASEYRFKRITELMAKYPKLNLTNTAAILRDRFGLKDQNIGMGNEKASNQLIAHHSIIFKPKQRIVWVSTSPYQLGKYVAYDLNKVFSNKNNFKTKKEITEQDLTIPADSFLQSKEYKDFVMYKKTKAFIKRCSNYKGKVSLNDNFVENFISTNPEYYDTYIIVGDFYFKSKIYKNARKFYTMALTKEISTIKERNYVNEQVSLCNKLEKY